ncbi:MAG: hypothetical protein ABW185_26095 [Sedimenticola sp.]
MKMVLRPFNNEIMYRRAQLGRFHLCGGGIDEKHPNETNEPPTPCRTIGGTRTAVVAEPSTQHTRGLHYYPGGSTNEVSVLKF